MAKRSDHELLVVDGYNVIFGTPRYKSLMDEPGERDLDHDPFERARELLVADVAAFAQGRYEPVIVFDAAGNVNPEHPELRRAGVRMIFSPTGVTADTVIERLVGECRRQMREVTVVTSDNTIRATVGGIPVTRISSAMLAHEIDVLDSEREVDIAERRHGKLTVEDRLDAKTLAKLNALLGR
ncbi:NYN domain-containing protein [uncultured Parolsenella sp.]|uniref:NYN domain-containing protein n=1 Tax=uncultured Parolsenella sp. TaxID=2083008 RepID=UPI0025DA5E32|nr:NYN domain-containing protein [uncultured Parolsenella sp.]